MTINPPDYFFDVPIIHKTYKFYLYLYSCIKFFPKKDRYTIGGRCENLTLNILELLFLTNAELNQKKLPILRNIDTKLKILKTLIRLAFDLKIINEKRYLSLQAQLQEIGRMLGGWIKSLKLNPAFWAGQ